MTGRLFEVAILEHPTKEAADKGEPSKLVFGPKAVVAANEQGALVAALLDGDRPNVDMQRAQVLVRPFAISFREKGQDPEAQATPYRATPKKHPERSGVLMAAMGDLMAAAPQPSTGFMVPSDLSSVTYGKAPRGHSYTGANLAALNIHTPSLTTTTTSVDIG